MLAVLITLTPGRWNEFIDCQKAKVRIVVLPIMDVETRWNSTVELLERSCRLQQFTHEWLKNPKYSKYKSLYTTEDEWTIVKYAMEVITPFQSWTLRMSKRHTVTLHHAISVYNDMFDHMDGVMRALAKKKTQWKEDLYFAVKFARQKLSKFYAEVTPTTGMLGISAHTLDSLRKLGSFKKWDKGMDINPEDETSDTTQHQEAFLKYVENEYCANHRRMSITKHEKLQSNDFIHSATPSQSGQSSFDPYDLSSGDEEYLKPKDFAETTPGRSNRAARLLAAARLYLNSPPELPKNWGRVNPNLDDYHSDPMEISRTFWIPDIAEWWRQQEETHSKYADLSNVARDIFPIIPHGVEVEANFSLGRDVIGWRQSKTTGETLREKVVVRQYARANNRILAGDDPGFDRSESDHDLELKREAEEKKLHRMAKVHDFLDMWQGSHNLRATQKESRAQNKQMTAVGYISDTEECIKASCSIFQHDSAAACKLSEKSPLPPALSAKQLAGGRIQVLNVRRIRRINRHPAESDDDSAPESVSNTENWLNWNSDLDNPNESKDDCDADNESDVERENCFEDPECPEQRDVCAAPNIPGLLRPIGMTKKRTEKGLVTVNATETRRIRGNRKKYGRMGQFVFSRFFMLLDREFHLENYDGRIMTSYV